jgi:hypothetical protein
LVKLQQEIDENNDSYSNKKTMSDLIKTIHNAIDESKVINKKLENNK